MSPICDIRIYLRNTNNNVNKMSTQRHSTVRMKWAVCLEKQNSIRALTISKQWSITRQTRSNFAKTKEEAIRKTNRKTKTKRWTIEFGVKFRQRRRLYVVDTLGHTYTHTYGCGYS